ncbi:hypothetical protein [Pseudosporangium ferrugineum]|uniref:hypothetical protein n=1 Tax=Pseudosporangium ferrugineum TaxID=439699 RepID=UPI001304D4C4|nr:hypothetical protein [Pseudosporangium ferrugineum]
MQNTEIAASARLVLVDDGGPEDQQWMDQFIASALSGEGDWPHAHPGIPRTVVSLDQVWRAIAANIRADGEPWSVRELGYPPLPGTVPASIAAPPPPDHPNKGSTSHNLLHSILGDFH